MLFLYIYCLTFVCVVNCNSTDEKLKELNILVNNDVWSEFEKGPRPIEHTNGQSRKISFRELFSKSNGAVFTEENYLEKSKNFHTMLSCNFAVGFKYITIIMNELWKESKKYILEHEKTENGSSEETGNEKDCKDNLRNDLCQKCEHLLESEEKGNCSGKEFAEEKVCYEKLKDELSKIFSESKIKEVGSSEEDYNENIICENNETLESEEEEENGSSGEFNDEDDCQENFISEICEQFYEQWTSRSEDIGSSSTPIWLNYNSFLATEKTVHGSSEEIDVVKYYKGNLINNLDASVPELMRHALSYFMQLSEIEEKESILPALDIMTQFANDKFSIENIDNNILKMNTILTSFIKNNCWFKENRTGPMLKTADDIDRDCWLTCSEQHYLSVQIEKLNEYFKKKIMDLGFQKVE